MPALESISLDLIDRELGELLDSIQVCIFKAYANVRFEPAILCLFVLVLVYLQPPVLIFSPITERSHCQCVCVQ